MHCDFKLLSKMIKMCTIERNITGFHSENTKRSNAFDNTKPTQWKTQLQCINTLSVSVENV